MPIAPGSYIEQRKQTDFKREAVALHKDVLRGMRSHTLRLTKNGHNRGFTCPQCKKKFTTRNPDHLGMMYTHLYYGIDHSQKSYLDAEAAIDYKTEEEKDSLAIMQNRATTFTGNYCSKKCATKRVNTYFKRVCPEFFEENM